MVSLTISMPCHGHAMLLESAVSLLMAPVLTRLVVSSQGSGDRHCSLCAHDTTGYMGIEPPANTEFLPLDGTTHVRWARECWVNLRIGMFVNPSEEWVQ